MLTSRIFAALTILLPCIVVFGPVLWKGECFTQRDAGYYYYPLLEYNARQWQQGEIPLWNPLENIGTPIVEDATAAVFYPGQLLLVAPVFDFATRYVLYVALHVFLAALGAGALCRVLGCSRSAAILAGVAYAFSGSVLYQHCNVIFLVGAAWLPIALAFGFKTLVLGSWRSALGCSAAVAMMVLGGEPQSAYHAMLVLSLLVVVRWFHSRRSNADVRAIEREGVGSLFRVTTSPSDTDNSQKRLPTPSTLTSLLMVALIGAFAFALAAIQIFPSAQWSSRSQRKTFVVPRNVYEVPEYLTRDNNAGWRGVNAGLTGIPIPGTHHEHAYQFSNPPWSLAELLFPNVSGRMDSFNRRWTHQVPGADRMWTPSLYMGLLPILLAISCFSLRSENIAVRWASWMLLVFALGSFGWYGIGWLLHQIAWCCFGVPPQQIPMGAGTGGLYWLMVKFLPGYVYFRYPAKLFVVASLGIAVLAAHGFDRLQATRVRRLQISCYTLLAISLLGLLASFLFDKSIGNYFDAAPADYFFGPLNSLAAIGDIRIALLHSAIVASILVAVQGFVPKPAVLALATVLDGSKPGLATKQPEGCLVSGQSLVDNAAIRPTTDTPSKFRARAVGLVLFTMIELLIANHSMVITGPNKLWTENNLTSAMVHQRSLTTAAAIPPRIFRGQVWMPPDWSKNSSTNRLNDSVQFNRETLFPKHPLQEDIGVVESFNSIAPYDYWAFMTVARTGGFERADGVIEPNKEMLELLSAEFLLLPSVRPQLQNAIALPSPALPVSKSQGGEASNTDSTFVLAPTTDPYPRCWLVPAIKQIPELHSNDPDLVGQQTRAALIENGNLRDFRRTVVVECDAAIEFENGDDLSADSSCEIVEYESDRISIQVRCEQQVVLVLNDYHYPGWQAWLETNDKAVEKELIIHRTNRIMRGVVIPVGEHVVRFVYRPQRLRFGIWISVVSWLLLSVGLLVFRKN